jgi:hypothetical protein
VRPQRLYPHVFCKVDARKALPPECSQRNRPYLAIGNQIEAFESLKEEVLNGVHPAAVLGSKPEELPSIVLDLERNMALTKSKNLTER